MVKALIRIESKNKIWPILLPMGGTKTINEYCHARMFREGSLRLHVRFGSELPVSWQRSAAIDVPFNGIHNINNKALGLAFVYSDQILGELN